jgi:hypothetical protein
MGETAGNGRAGAPTLREAVGETALLQLQGLYLNYLDTAAAIVERDGTWACAEFRSEYCLLLRRASRQLGPSADGGCERCCEGLSRAAGRAMAMGQAAFDECRAGLLVLAFPIVAWGSVVGSNAIVVGAPPPGASRLGAVADTFRLPPPLLQAVARPGAAALRWGLEAVVRHIEGTADIIRERYEGQAGAWLGQAAPRPSR